MFASEEKLHPPRLPDGLERFGPGSPGIGARPEVIHHVAERDLGGLQHVAKNRIVFTMLAVFRVQGASGPPEELRFLLEEFDDVLVGLELALDRSVQDFVRLGRADKVFAQQVRIGERGISPFIRADSFAVFERHLD